jgi:hypothetical protein
VGRRLARHGGWFVERYVPRIFERWVHGFNGKNGMWMYDPNDKAFWLGRLAGHQTYVEESSWFSEGGEENYSGGFWKLAERQGFEPWVDLRPQRFSRPPRSTTPAPLRTHGGPCEGAM